MECEYPTVDRRDDAEWSDIAAAQRAPACILISAAREAAWETARSIAQGCSVDLCRIDCDTADQDQLADALREQVGDSGRGAIVFLREVQELTPANQQLLEELIACERRSEGRPRLIASSSLSLYEKTCAGLFAERLFYRLNVVHLTRAGANTRRSSLQ